MKKLYIHGSFMNDNYGDFLLYYVVESIVEKYESKYIWCSSDVDTSYDKYCKVNRKNKSNAIKDAELVIFAGGGYFGEPANDKFKWNIRCLLKHIIPAYRVYKKKIPYIIVGVEAGPISFGLNRHLMKKIFDGAEKVSVRNEESMAFLKKINVKNEIEVNPDWIMGINENDFPIKDINVDEIIDSTKKNIFVHLTSGIDTIGMENVVNDLIEYQNNNRDIRYIIGCDQAKSTQKENVKKIFDIINNQDNKFLLYDSPWHLSKILNSVDAVITDKLHVGIVATKYGKEVICTAKHPKSVKFYNVINRSEWANLLSSVKSKETLDKLNNLTFNKVKINQNVFVKAENNKKIVEQFLKQH